MNTCGLPPFIAMRSWVVALPGRGRALIGARRLARGILGSDASAACARMFSATERAQQRELRHALDA